jgi:GT2 family glycosyltransferase
MPPLSTNSKISIVIPSKGRSKILEGTLDSIQHQTLPPEKIIVVVPSEEDLPGQIWREHIQTIVGPLGSCVQRNAAISAIPLSVPYVAFFDDDFELKADYLAQAVAFMDANPTIVGFSGLDLAGKNSVTREQAQQMLKNFVPDPKWRGAIVGRRQNIILYGCNMVIRRSALEYERFDENLPLYSYGEDYDLTMRLIQYGPIGLFRGTVGVHLQTSSGRVREVQRGYSQIANNWYFLKKGTVHLTPRLAWIRFWFACVLRPILIGLGKILRRDTAIDWPGRVKGYLLAVRDIFTGHSSPQRIREL